MADISVRGAPPEQALVLLNGLRMDNAETAHFNLDLPIPLFTIIFALTLLLVFGLIPAPMVLSFVLLSENVSTALASTQCVLFVASIVMYWAVCFAQTYSEGEAEQALQSKIVALRKPPKL